MYASLERAAVQQWDSKGIFIPETIAYLFLDRICQLLPVGVFHISL